MKWQFFFQRWTGRGVAAYKASRVPRICGWGCGLLTVYLQNNLHATRAYVHSLRQCTGNVSTKHCVLYTCLCLSFTSARRHRSHCKSTKHCAHSTGLCLFLPLHYIPTKTLCTLYVPMLFLTLACRQWWSLSPFHSPLQALFPQGGGDGVHGLDCKANEKSQNDNKLKSSQRS